MATFDRAYELATPRIRDWLQDALMDARHECARLRAECADLRATVAGERAALKPSPRS